MHRSPVRAVLLEQAGVISRGQASQTGLTDRQIDYRVASGEWRRVFPGVFRHAAVPPTPEAEVRAAALWLGRGTLTGSGAGWWWDLVPDPPTRWEFALPGSSRPDPQPRVLVRRCFVDPYDLTRRRGLPVVSRPLALLRSAAELERHRRGDGVGLIDRNKYRRTVQDWELDAAFRRNRGTWGTTVMRYLMDHAGDRARSELERLGVRLLRGAGITGFEVNRTIRVRSGRRIEVDLLFRAQKVAIELDGYAFHGGPDEHQADLRRMNELMADGWTVRRFTYWDLVNDPEGFLRVIREVLAAQPHVG